MPSMMHTLHPTEKPLGRFPHQGAHERGFLLTKPPSRFFKPFYYVFRADVWVLLKKYVEIIAIHLIFGGVCV